MVKAKLKDLVMQILWEVIVGPHLVPFGCNIGLDKRTWQDLVCVRMRHSHCLYLLSGKHNLNKAECFERQAAGCVKLEPGSCLLSSLTSVSGEARTSGLRLLKVGQQGEMAVEMSL